MSPSCPRRSCNHPLPWLIIAFRVTQLMLHLQSLSVIVLLRPVFGLS